MVLDVKGQSSRPSDGTAVRVLDAAERLFYARGIHAVGMDDVRTAAQVSLKRLYQLYPSKGELVVAFLDRRDRVWRERVSAFVATRPDPQQRLLAVFDCLELLFAEDDFRGCAWINAYGELGAVSADIARLATEHKSAFHRLVQGLVQDAGLPASLTDQISLLVEGALATAGISHTTGPAVAARAAASTLITAAGLSPNSRGRASAGHGARSTPTPAR